MDGIRRGVWWEMIAVRGAMIHGFTCRRLPSPTNRLRLRRISESDPLQGPHKGSTGRVIVRILGNISICTQVRLC